MNLFSAIVYGAIQGLTEFLPVSSSAHLALLPYALGIPDPGVGFDLMMHVGTALAVILYFQKRLRKLLSYLPRLVRVDPTPPTPEEEKDLFYLRNLILATFVSFVFIFVLKGLAFKFGRSPNFMAVNLLFFGIIMVLADRWGKNPQGTHREMESGMRLPQSCLIGLFQAIAIFPGVSRSGATLTVSRLMGMSREEAADFSFILSIPVIVAATLAKLVDYMTQALFQSNDHWQNDLIIGAAGVFTSFVVGMVTIHFFLKWIKKVGLFYFSVYRVVLAGILFWVFR